MATSERALATWLSSRDDAALAETFAARSVSATVNWHDFFDAAAALLDAASIDRALARLPRRTLIELADPDAAAPSAVDERLALHDENGRPYAAVTARVLEGIAAHPEAFVEAPALAANGALPVASPDQEAAAAEQAFTTAGALADVLLMCVHTPLTRTGTGAVSAVDRKRLLETGAVNSAEELDDLVDSAAGAGLLRSLGREWLVTPAGDHWLEETTTTRWTTIVRGLVSALPRGLRAADGTIFSPQEWPAAYPLDPDWAARAERLERIAHRWGFLSPDGSIPAWTRQLLAGEIPDAAALAKYLPAEIDKVYLQADLTAIAPGPLAPALDLRLRGIARRESRAQASSYRFTAESIGAGMTEGESAASIKEFLAGISLTGLPQPLEYLIDSTAGRHGLVRVQTDEVSGRTKIVSLDPAVRDAIAVDQALRPLGLIRDGEALSSRVTRDAVYWSLADARYPVIALDAGGAPEPLHRRSPAVATEADATPVDVYARVLTNLRATHGTDGDAAWLERELDQAVRGKLTIVVGVRLPDGGERSFTLEATGLGGGRLRGRDRGADIERTLPLSSITSVRPA